MHINSKKIIYLDRDGVINEDFSYVYKIEEFQFINGVFEACKHFIKLGYDIIIITNQSGIGRKYYTNDDFLKLTKWMKKEFLKQNINILEVYYCPHTPNDNCSCRKPKTGMILKSLNDFNINIEKSWLIGDKISDIKTAINANIKNNILISKEKNNEVLNVAESLFDTIKIIKE